MRISKVWRPSVEEEDRCTGKECIDGRRRVFVVGGYEDVEV
jgi:hypothetical protein